MSFNIEKCAIPTIWCGKGAPPKRKGLKWYAKTGSRYECMKKGFGAGAASERKKYIPNDSLQQIPYIGDVYERKFKRAGIPDISQLLHEAENHNKNSLKSLLQKIFTRKRGGLDKRAYNSTIVFLYQHGIGHIPPCFHLI